MISPFKKQYALLYKVMFMVLSLIAVKPSLFGQAVESGTPQYEIKTNVDKVVIPFEMFRGDIRMIAKINGKECRLLLDNGSLWDELLFFGSPTVDSLHLEATGEIYLGDSTIDNPFIADLAEKNITVDFDQLNFKDQTGVITRYQPGLPNPWEGADGQISAAFFKNFITSIDFDKQIITLETPTKAKYKVDGYVLTMKEGPHNSRTVEIEVEMENGHTQKLDFQIDLGAIYPIYLPLGKYDEIVLPKNAKKETLGIGVGIPSNTGYVGNIPKINIGGCQMENVLTAFTPVEKSTDVYGNTMIGMPLLQKFNVRFDYFQNLLIIKPNKSFKKN